MDIWQVLVIAGRRWKVTLPLIVIGVVMAWVYSGGVKPIYNAEASLLYLPPAATIVVTGDPGVDDSLDDEGDTEVIQVSNPFAGSLRSATLAAELHMGSDAVAGELSALGLSTSYAVTADRRNAVLYLTAQASSPGRVIDTIEELIGIAESDLTDRQNAFDVDVREQVTLQVVTQDQAASADFGGRLRVRAILLILAVGGAFGVVVLLEGFLDHRAGRRPFSGGSGAVDPMGAESLTIQIPADLVREVASGPTGIERSAADLDRDEAPRRDLDRSAVGDPDVQTPKAKTRRQDKPRGNRWSRESEGERLAIKDR